MQLVAQAYDFVSRQLQFLLHWRKGVSRLQLAYVLRQLLYLVPELHCRLVLGRQLRRQSPYLCSQLKGLLVGLPALCQRSPALVRQLPIACDFLIELQQPCLELLGRGLQPAIELVLLGEAALELAALFDAPASPLLF